MSNLGKKFISNRRFDHDTAAAMYAQGLSAVQIGKHFCVAPNNVLVALRRMGVEIRSLSDSISLRKRGNRRLDSQYITVCAGKGIRKKEHVMIAEAALGRPLKKGELVHHINCDKTDNRRENLLICTVAYHTALHHRMRKHPYFSQFNNTKGA